jgi:hypothetical protein
MRIKLTSGASGLLLCLLLSVTAVGQGSSSDVHVKLAVVDSRTSFRVGEPIQLVLEFTADRDGYEADTIPDGTEPTSDKILVSPASGVTRWLEDYLGTRMGRDVFAPKQLSATPTRVPFFLNDTIRFDRPGRYSIKVTTSRVLPTHGRGESRSPVVLTTNEVTLDIVPMGDTEEEQEVKKISDLLAAARGWQAEDQLGQRLAYLTGDVSSREKVRYFLHESRSGNFQARIYYGVFIARNRSLVLQLLKTGMRDSATPVTQGLLQTIVALRRIHESTGVPGDRLAPNPESDPRFLQIRDSLVIELAAGLVKRTGVSQTTTATTILACLPKDPQSSAALLQGVRPILIQQFDSLHPYSQEYLLRQYWDQLRDRSLLPSLKKMLSPGSNRGIHGLALKRLIEMAPDEARAFVIAEIRDSIAPVDLEILGSLPDNFLPEVDAPLLAQIKQLALVKTNFDRVALFLLKYRAARAARYATDAIYSDLMDVYKNGRPTRGPAFSHILPGITNQRG